MMQCDCTDAVILHRVADPVKASASTSAPDLRALRVARTEAQLVAAAAELFLSQGYQATTLAAVARRAGLAPRTVYLRFGSKATLFGRVVDQALAGDVGANGCATSRPCAKPCPRPPSTRASGVRRLLRRNRRTRRRPV